MSELLKRQRYGVQRVGVDVDMILGEQSCRLEYRVALHLAAMLYSVGMEAKRAAGDQSTEVIGLARLTDANLDEMKAQRSRDGTAVFSKA